MIAAAAVLACAALLAPASAQFNTRAFAGFGQPQRFQLAPAPAPLPAPRFAPAPAPLPAPRFAPIPATRYGSDERAANIISQDFETYPDGSYKYYFNTDNGITAEATGTPRNFGGNPPIVPDVAQGSFSWTSPEGQVVSIAYVADENGYQPQGDAIPTPPPVPPQIARALEYLARAAPRK